MDRHTLAPYSRDRLTVRSCEALLGICAGIMADGHINDDEINFLAVWLEDNTEFATMWPGDILAGHIRQVLADGIITGDERAHLGSVLKQIIGGTIQDTGATSGIPTDLPVNHDAIVTIAGAKVCHTGTFLYGSRKKCEEATHKAGGSPTSRVTLALNYLVIGSLVTGSWKQTSFGNKIAKAVEYQRKGCELQIVSESQWMNSL